jgi:hypothetical protein
MFSGKSEFEKHRKFEVEEEEEKEKTWICARQ